MFIREIRSESRVALDGYGSVDTMAVFKQYDVNTSILILDMTFAGSPLNIGNEAIFISLKNSKELVTSKWDKLKADDKGVLLLGEKLSNGSIKFTLTPLALELSGDIEGEVIFVDVQTQQRTTSQKFNLKIEASLTPNLKGGQKYAPVKDFDGNFITDLESFELIAPTLEANATAIKLNYTGDQINAILKKANDLDLSNLTPSWDNIAGKPSSFPPATHNHQDLYYAKNETYTKAESDAKIKTAIDGIVIPDVDLTGYATNKKVEDAVNKLDADKAPINHDHNMLYYTKKFVNDALNLKANSANVYEKAEVYTKAVTDSRIATEIGKIPQTDISGLATITELTEAYNRLDEVKCPKIHGHDDVYYAKRFIDEKLDLKADVVDVYNKTEVFPKTETYNKTTIDEKIANVAGGGNVDLSNYYTKSQTYSKQESNILLSEKANANDTYSVLETNEAIATEIAKIPATDLSNYYTKPQSYSRVEVDSLLSTKPDGSSFYTKAQIDNKIKVKADKSSVFTKVEIGNSLSTKTLNVSGASTLYDLTISNYFQSGGVLGTIYCKAPKIEATETLLVGTMNVKTEIEALKQAGGGSDNGLSPSHRVIPKVTNEPLKNEIYIKESAGAEMSVAISEGTPAINGNNFHFTGTGQYVVVTFLTDGAIEIDCTTDGTGYYNFSLTGCTGASDWQSGVKKYIFEGTAGATVRVSQDAQTDVGWRFTASPKVIEELHYMGSNGDKKISFDTIAKLEKENAELKKKIELIELKILTL